MADEKKPLKKIVERDWDDISEIRKAKAAPEEEVAEEAVAKPPPAPAKVTISDEPTSVLEDMKAHGVDGAIVRADGAIVHSTMPLTDAAAGMIASAANITDALMKRSSDVPREIEITFGSTILVLIPIGSYVFCGSVKDREEKKIIREFAEKAKAVL
jgi:predicted regulator of Ras-like GTPase activity (Roadblock/LC7/MglB family)